MLYNIQNQLGNERGSFSVKFVMSALPQLSAPLSQFRRSGEVALHASLYPAAYSQFPPKNSHRPRGGVFFLLQ